LGHYWATNRTRSTARQRPNASRHVVRGRRGATRRRKGPGAHRSSKTAPPLVRALAQQRHVAGGCPTPRPEARACPPSAAALLARLGVELRDKQAVQVACEVPTGRGQDAIDLQLLVLAQCSGPCHQPQGSVF
jgi:hypothetical protein